MIEQGQSFVDIARDGRDIVASGIAALIAIAGAIHLIARRFSKDRVMRAAESSDVNTIARFERLWREACERADMFADQRNRAIEELGGLRAEVQHLRADALALRNEAAALRLEVNQLRDRVQKLGVEVDAPDG